MPRRRPLTEVTGRIIRDAGLTASEKLIYLFVAAEYRTHYHNPSDYGSYDQLAKETHFSVSTVRKGLKKLVGLELLSVDKGSTWLHIEVLHLDNGYSLLRQLASAGAK